MLNDFPDCQYKVNIWVPAARCESVSQHSTPTFNTEQLTSALKYQAQEASQVGYMQLIWGKRFLSHRKAQMWKSELLKQARTNKNHSCRPEDTPVLQCPPGLHKAMSSLFSIHQKMLTHQGGVDFNRGRTAAPFPSYISLGTGTVESAYHPLKVFTEHQWIGVTITLPGVNFPPRKNFIKKKKWLTTQWAPKQEICLEPPVYRRIENN